MSIKSFNVVISSPLSEEEMLKVYGGGGPEGGFDTNLSHCENCSNCSNCLKCEQCDKCSKCEKCDLCEMCSKCSVCS